MLSSYLLRDPTISHGVPGDVTYLLRLKRTKRKNSNFELRNPARRVWPLIVSHSPCANRNSLSGNGHLRSPRVHMKSKQKNAYERASSCSKTPSEDTQDCPNTDERSSHHLFRPSSIQQHPGPNQLHLSRKSRSPSTDLMESGTCWTLTTSRSQLSIPFDRKRGVNGHPTAAN